MKTINAMLYSAFDTLDVKHIVEFLHWLAHSYNYAVTSVLDIGCGPGRMLEPLAKSGWLVTGIEPFTDFYKQAETLADQTKNITVEQIGFNDISHTEAFDLITAINGSFSYLLTPAAREDALKRIHCALRPGGVVFLDMANFAFILLNYIEPKTIVAEFEEYRIERNITHEVDFHRNLFIHTDRFVYTSTNQDEGEKIQKHTFSIFGFPALEALFERIGYIDVRTYNERFASRSAEKLTGSRMMVSAQKPLEAQPTNRAGLTR